MLAKELKYVEGKIEEAKASNQSVGASESSEEESDSEEESTSDEETSSEEESSEKQNSDLRVTKMNSAFKAFDGQQKVTVNKFEAPASSNNS